MPGLESHPSSQANIYPGGSTYDRGSSQWEQFHAERNEHYYEIREHAAVMATIEPAVGAMLFAPDSRYLKDPREDWQPADHLPDWSNPEAAIAWIQEFQREVEGVPDELWEVSVGGEITEDTIANYPQQIVRLFGMEGTSGADQLRPSVVWVNGWTAQEDTHGSTLKPLHAYSGRVDVRKTGISVQALYRNGFDPRLANDPYGGVFYTARQERGTKTPHARAGLTFRRLGAIKMANAYGDIAGHEANHEKFYTHWGGLIFEIDPDGAMVVYNRIMQENIVMPGGLMTHGDRVSQGQRTTPEFDHFAAVSHMIGTYTAADYADDSKHFVKAWGLDKLTLRTDKGKRAQEQLFAKMKRDEGRLDSVMTRRAQRMPDQPSPWLYDRSVSMQQAAEINIKYLYIRR